MSILSLYKEAVAQINPRIEDVFIPRGEVFGDSIHEILEGPVPPGEGPLGVRLLLQPLLEHL